MMSLPLEVNSETISQPVLPIFENNQEKSVEKSRQCPICKVYYKYGNSYWQHVRYVHANFLSQCIICGKSYKRMTMAKQHVLHFHKIAWHLCSNYVKKVKKNDNLSQNKIKDKSIERRKQSLKYFKKKTLHLISSFNCYDCPGTFTTINELFAHVKEHRNKQETDSEMESDGEDVQNISVTEISEIQNGLLKEIEEIQNGSINESEIPNGSINESEIQNGLVNKPEDAQNASVSEIEDIEANLVSDNEKIPNGSVNEFDALENFLTSDVAFKIQ